mgnify:CR=1 FL=1
MVVSLEWLIPSFVNTFGKVINNILITNPRDIKSFVKELRKHRFTFISGVNTLFNKLLLDSNFKKIIAEYKPDYIFKEKKKNTISINYNNLISLIIEDAIC